MIKDKNRRKIVQKYGFFLLNIVFYIGIILIFCALFILGIIGVSAKKSSNLDETQRIDALKKLVIINFGAVGLAIFGLMMVFLTLQLGASPFWA